MSKRLLLVMSLVAVQMFGARSSSAAVLSRSLVEEESAVLSFTTVSDIVCEDGSSSTLVTDVFVLAEERSEPGTASSTTVYAEVVQRNGCTGEFLELFTPEPVPVPGAELSGVDAATVNTSLELIDFSTGEPFVLDLDLAFIGTGDQTRHFERTTSCSGGLTTRTRTSLDSRIASVEGTVALNGDELLSGVEYFAQLEERRTGEVTVQRAACACSSGNIDSEVASAGVAVPASATVTRTEFESESANATFRNFEDIVCADGSAGTLETYVNTPANSFSDGTTTNSDASAFLLQSNSCTGETVVGFASVRDPDYEQQGVTSATLNEDFELLDPSTGEPLGILDTDLVFTGAGGASCSTSFSITHSPPGVFGEGRVTAIRLFERVSSAATVSGSVSFEGLELVDDVEFAELVATRQETMFIQH